MTAQAIDTPQPPTNASRRRWQLSLAVLAILAAHWLIATSSTTGKCAAFDELAHLTGGYTYWMADDYRLMPAGGILPQRLAALPVYLGDFAFPSLEHEEWYTSQHWWLGRRFFYYSGNNVHDILWRGRAAIAALSCALGLLVLLWSRRLFGVAGALLSLVVYAVSPAILANGRLATSDTAAAFGFALAAACWWRAIHRVSLASVLASCGAATIVLAAKASGLLFVPIAMVLAAIRVLDSDPIRMSWRGRSFAVESRLRQTLLLLGLVLIHILLVGFAIWALYGFRFASMRTAEPGRDSLRSTWQQEIESVDLPRPFLEFAHDNKLLPESYLYGVTFTLARAKERAAFLNGEHRMTGWWYYFPVAFLLKTPLPTLLLLLGLIVMALLKWGLEGGIKQSLYRTAPIWVVLAIYGFAAIRSNLNIGYRHVLPMLPLVFVLLGGLGPWLDRRTPKAAGLILFATAWLCVESALIYPHYLSYFNPIAGGPKRGYQIMVDSSLDWGQDLPALGDYLAKRSRNGRPNKPVYLAYFGTGDPKTYGVEANHLDFYLYNTRRAEPLQMQGGIYCLSASVLQGVATRGVFGRWSPAFETEYQRLKKLGAPFLRANGNVDFELTERFERLRLARLCAALRQREPDDRVAYSILVYELTDDFVAEALLGPPEPLYGK